MNIFVWYSELNLINLVLFYTYLFSIPLCAFTFYNIMKDQPRIARKNLATAGMYILAPVLNTSIIVLFTIEEFMVYRGTILKDEQEKRDEKREQHIFGFLAYKGHTLAELDDYINSRNVIAQLIDKARWARDED